jgi:uncharacterized membrane protein
MHRIFKNITCQLCNRLGHTQKNDTKIQLIVQEHVQAILNAPPLNKTIYSGLRQLLDTVISNLEAQVFYFR